ncbi:hypothetical protein [Galactobacter valiniphilus]|uniref:hypothetical protein n=1 Tax=Galactobacter valiniphilus TaxID=2676122 RepID=UPI0037365415
MAEDAGPGEEAGWDELPERGRVQLRGYVAAVTYPSSLQAPVFSAVLAPDLAPPGGRKRPVERVKLVWLGQRRVPGIGAGGWLRCRGMLLTEGGKRVMYDPSYEILEAEEDNA